MGSYKNQTKFRQNSAFERKIVLNTNIKEGGKGALKERCPQTQNEKRRRAKKKKRQAGLKGALRALLSTRPRLDN